jgi:MoxR-like ATPase
MKHVVLSDCFKQLTLPQLKLAVPDAVDQAPPALDPTHVWSEQLVTELTAFWLSRRRGLALKGGTGAGKTSSVIQWHARLGAPLLMPMQSDDETARSWFGSMQPTETGGLQFRKGPLTLAAERGWTFFTNEFNRLDPREQLAFNEILDGNPFMIPQTGEWVTPAPSFRFMIAVNPSVRGVYTGRSEQEISSRHRFWWLTVEGLSESEERDLVLADLRNYGMDGDDASLSTLAESFVRVARMSRSQFAGDHGGVGQLMDVIDTRTLRSWVCAYVLFRRKPNGLHLALRVALTGGSRPADAAAIHEFVAQIFGITPDGAVAVPKP